jgi:hypothetical protein
MSNLWASTETYLAQIGGGSTQLQVSAGLPRDLAALLPRFFRQGGSLVPVSLGNYAHDMAGAMLVIANNWRELESLASWYVQRGLPRVSLPTTQPTTSVPRTETTTSQPTTTTTTVTQAPSTTTVTQAPTSMSTSTSSTLLTLSPITTTTETPPTGTAQNTDEG